mmetsp:Transcript_20655/g.60011  ORF Transcript_20655/g.60011 Transcript_20655/m.60011 type:complete len:282 (+) Transcript_20655:227-1072(+)
MMKPIDAAMALVSFLSLLASSHLVASASFLTPDPLAKCLVLRHSSIESSNPYFKRNSRLGLDFSQSILRGDRMYSAIQCKEIDGDDPAESVFFVREAVFADLGAAAKIITDGFFSDSTNFVTYQVERLKTFLSLESTFPDSKDKGSHEMIVACLKNGAKVVGFVELDCRETDDPKLPPRPYMCNLVVDKKWLRKGIATALVKECESISASNGKERIFLKVRERNAAATSMYEHMGYVVEACSVENDDVLLLMKKDLRPEHESSVWNAVSQIGPMFEEERAY